MDKNAELQKLSKLTGIADFATANDHDFKTIQRCIADGQITQSQLELLIGAMPHFVDLQRASVDGLKAVIQSAKESQRDALQGFSTSLESIAAIMKELASKSESDECRIKLAELTIQLTHYNLEIAKIIKETNEDNNNTWKILAGGLASVAIAVFSLFAMNQKK